LNIGGASPQRGVQSPRQSLYAVITNQHSLINNPIGNNLLSAAIYSNLVSTATVNYYIMALSTATQQ